MEVVKKAVLSSMLSCLILFSVLVSSQMANPGSAGISGIEKNNFLTTDTVYAKSAVIICTRNKTVDLYIVADKAEWNNGDDLVDVRGSSQQVTTDMNANLPLTKIWENPKGGKYDIIVDCNQNKKYDSDPFLEPIDDASKSGFTVTAIAGKGDASIVNVDFGNFWQYDSESSNLINEMIEFSLNANGENILLDNISIKASGTGNDMGDIEKIEVYADTNNNNKKDEADTKIGEAVYSEDNGTVSFPVEYGLLKNVTSKFIIVYVMKPEATGNFSLSIISVYGKGENSDKEIGFSGAPLNSKEKMIITPNYCSGTVTLVLNPNSVKPFSSVTANINNLTGCQNKTVTIQTYLCGLTSTEGATCSCVAGVSGCDCNFAASDKNKTYWACIDKNDDKDLIDFGESAFSSLIVYKEEIKPIVANETAKENISSLTNITGNVIKLEEEKITAKTIFGQTNLLFLTIELTLVLILIILFLILIRLGRRKNSKKEED